MPRGRQQPAMRPDPSSIHGDPFATQRRMTRQVGRLLDMIKPFFDLDEEGKPVPGSLSPNAPSEEIAQAQSAYQASLAPLEIYAWLVAALEAPKPAIARTILGDLRARGQADPDDVVIRRLVAYLERHALEVFAIPVEIHYGELLSTLRAYLLLRPLQENDPVVCGNCGTTWTYGVARSWGGALFEAFVRGEGCPHCDTEQPTGSPVPDDMSQQGPPQTPQTSPTS